MWCKLMSLGHMAEKLRCEAGAGEETTYFINTVIGGFLRYA